MTKEIAKTEKVDIMASDNEFDVPSGFINTFDISTDDGKMAVLKAYNAAQPLNNHVGEVIKVCDVITMPGVRKGRNGMPDTDCQNTYLIDVDGNAYFSQSDGVARSLQMFIALYPDLGKSTEKGCIELSCIEQELGNGNTLKTLIPA